MLFAMTLALCAIHFLTRNLEIVNEQGISRDGDQILLYSL